MTLMILREQLRILILALRQQSMGVITSISSQHIMRVTKALSKASNTLKVFDLNNLSRIQKQFINEISLFISKT